MNRTARVVAVLVGALAATAALAVDPPHGPTPGDSCSACHLMHNAYGSSLTTVAGNANLCDSCHSKVEDTDGNRFGLPWKANEDQAQPGTSGHSHRWDAPATSRGANVPANAEMASRIDQGTITCSVCHDQHNNEAGANSGTQHVGGARPGGTVTVGTTWPPNAPPVGAGTGEMKLEAVAPTAPPKHYRVRVSAVTTSPEQITYEYSNDKGTTWFPGGTTGTPSGALSMDSGNVQVSFATTPITSYKVGDYWEFWVSYPMLRISNVDDAMCEQCHQNRIQSHTRVEGGDVTYPANGANKFHHPVREPLANSYDRAGAILDANGLVQTTGGANADGNATNDIRLDSASQVRCTSCHDAHNADSNSLTVDPR